MTRAAPERATHIAVLDYLRSVLFGNPLIHHSPNELGLSGHEAARQVAKHKRLGMRPVFPDLVVFAHAGVMFFEVKTATGRITTAQSSVRDDLHRLGFLRFATVRSVADVREALAAWGIPTRENHPEKWEPLP